MQFQYPDENTVNLFLIQRRLKYVWNLFLTQGWCNFGGVIQLISRERHGTSLPDIRPGRSPINTAVAIAQGHAGLAGKLVQTLRVRAEHGGEPRTPNYL